MEIEAPYSKYKKNNLKIYIAVCFIAAAIFAYDGYLSKYEWSHRQDFYQKHVKDAKPDDMMVFNQKAPIFLTLLALALAARFIIAKNKKVIALENQLLINNKEKIAYDSIQKINKTYFDSKGFFIITYKNDLGQESDCKLSSGSYDNLGDILDHLVTKIS